jgi:hypothetical protein
MKETATKIRIRKQGKESVMIPMDGGIFLGRLLKDGFWSALLWSALLPREKNE